MVLSSQANVTMSHDVVRGQVGRVPGPGGSNMSKTDSNIVRLHGQVDNQITIIYITEAQ